MRIKTRSFLTPIRAALILALLSGCGPCKEKAPPAGSITMEELQNTTYAGFEDQEHPVTLRNGRWEGEPYAPGDASRPSVYLITDLYLTGDGTAKAVVFLGENSGGSGDYLYLAVVERVDGQPVNTTTVLIGDRVQIRTARMTQAEIVLDVVQSAEGDALCCPGDVVERKWSLRDGTLEEIGAPAVQGRLVPDILTGSRWVLANWDLDDPAPADPTIILQYAKGRFSGLTGCNNFFGPVSAGEEPGDLDVGEIGATKRSCGEPLDGIDKRFIGNLQRVNRFGFLFGRLALTYQTDGEVGMMVFRKME